MEISERMQELAGIDEKWAMDSFSIRTMLQDVLASTKFYFGRNTGFNTSKISASTLTMNPNEGSFAITIAGIGIIKFTLHMDDTKVTIKPFQVSFETGANVTLKNTAVTGTKGDISKKSGQLIYQTYSDAYDSFTKR